jgi:DNA polymerase-3 subunit epsilon
MRQIILDTETTGLRVEEGHRLIEIGCLEMINRKLTGEYYHQYVNPLRTVDPAAVAIHGITDEFLKDKPLFTQVADEFMNFIKGADLIIHNAPFDVSFINHELYLARSTWKQVSDHCSVIDTLQLARKMHAGQRNSLDALCKRYGVDNSKRDLHGALVDTDLLAQVYLAMTGGQGSFFDTNENRSTTAITAKTTVTIPLEKHDLLLLKADSNEIAEHKNYLALLKKQGKCQWEEEDVVSLDQ